MAQKTVVWRPGVAIVRESLVSLVDDSKLKSRNANGSDSKFISGVNIVKAFLAGESLNARPGWRKNRGNIQEEKPTKKFTNDNNDTQNTDSDDSPLENNQLCNFFFSDLGCKYGDECRFAHSSVMLNNFDYDDDGEGDEDISGDVSPIDPTIPLCPFLAVGCRFGPRCKYLHPIIYDDPESLLASAFATPSQSPTLHSPPPQASPLSSPWKSPRPDAPAFVPSAVVHASLPSSPCASTTATLVSLVPIQPRPLAMVLKQKAIENATFSTTHTTTTDASASITKKSLVFSPEFVPSASPTNTDYSETLMSTSSSPASSSPSTPSKSSPCPSSSLTRSLSLHDFIHSPVFSPQSETFSRFEGTLAEPVSNENVANSGEASFVPKREEKSRSPGRSMFESMKYPRKSSIKELDDVANSQTKQTQSIEAELGPFALPIESARSAMRRERNLSEHVTPSNEPWVPQWKQAENHELRERKLSAKDCDNDMSSNGFGTELWDGEHQNQFCRPSRTENRKLSEKFENLISAVEIETNDVDRTCFHVDL